MGINLKKQKGYLLIAAVVLIFIFSVVASLLALSYVRKGTAVSDMQQSKQALYIANSAMNIAKRALKQKTVTCSTINGNSNFTNASLLGGQMTVTGSTSDTSTTLASAITSSATSLTVANASTFASNGVVDIDNELIAYASKSGNVLSQLTRGVGNTTAIAHNSAAEVKQDQCLLTAKAADPSFANPKGEHELQAVMIQKLFNFEFGTPSLLSAAEITLRGNSSITNPAVTVGSEEFPGSTMISGSTIDIQGNAETLVSDGSGGTVVASDSGNINADVAENVSSLTSSNLASYYFDAPLSTIYGIADHSYDENNISGVAGKVIWITGNLNITGSSDYYIGTVNDPVILIVDGNFDISGSPDIYFYGLLYVTGDIDITGSTDIVGDGTIASEGSGSIDPGEVDLGGNMSINLNPANLDALLNLTPYVNKSYSSQLYLLHQVKI